MNQQRLFTPTAVKQMSTVVQRIWHITWLSSPDFGMVQQGSMRIMNHEILIELNFIQLS